MDSKSVKSSIITSTLGLPVDFFIFSHAIYALIGFLQAKMTLAPMLANPSAVA
jgi:hypothetical protein